MSENNKCYRIRIHKNLNNTNLIITHHFYRQVDLHTTLKFPVLRNEWYNEGVM